MRPDRQGRNPIRGRTVHRRLGRSDGSCPQDADDRFALDASRTSSDGFFEVYALASAAGLGVGWTQLNADAGQPVAEIRFRPEQLIRGKVVDINGLPAAGVELQIGSVGRLTDSGTFDGVNMGSYRPADRLRVWPRPVITDNEGRFTLAAIGRQLSVNFYIRDSRFAPQRIRVQTDNQEGPKEFTLALQPATILTGRVIAAATGETVAQTVVAGARGDDQGKFIASLSAGKRHRIEAFPAENAPYLVCAEEMTWPKGAIKKVMDIKLPRGAIIRGKVIEAGTGRALRGASVQYLAARSPSRVIDGWQAVVASKDDGSYQIVVPSGKGYLFIYGPTSDFILNVIGGRMIDEGQPGGERYYAHAIIAYEVKSGDPPHDINATLRPGTTVRGHLIGPDGKRVDDAMIIGTLHFNYFHLNWRSDLTRHARDGVFEVHGLDSDHPARVSFLDAEHQCGTTVELPGKQAGDEVTIRLQPCGTARARFVGPDGKPKANIPSFLELLGSPGPHQRDRRPESKSLLQADAVWLSNLDRKHYWNGPRTDADGRITLPDLIPGATYRIGDQSTINDNDGGKQIPKDFTVKPGETLDLGEISIGK